MKRRRCILSAAVFTALFFVFVAPSALAQPPEGTILTPFDSTVYGVGLGFDGQYLYVPDGIDSNELKIYDTAGVSQVTLTLTCTIGNLSYDATRNVFWAGQFTGNVPVYTINPATGVCTFQFDALPALQANGNCGNGCT